MARALGSTVATFLMTLTTALVVTACSRPVDPLGAPCGDDRDCSLGEICSAGTCSAGGVSTCVTDLDCDPGQNEVCNAGICAARNTNTSGDTCTATADCAISEFCNTAVGVCSPLLAGWCRQDGQCGSDTPLCSNAEQGESVPGRCVECLGDSDCSAGVCQAPGICVVDNACPDNASAVVGGTCRCNAGFEDDGAGGCVTTTPTPPDPTDPPPPDPTDPPPPEPTDPPPAGSTGVDCVIESDCYEPLSIDYTCGAAGECICDLTWMDFVCDGDVDAVNCACGTGGASGLNLNAECFDDLDCDGGLACIFSSGAGTFDPGVCKQECTADAECASLGLGCWEDIIDVGVGICADDQQRGETCDASVYSDLLDGDRICDIPATDILDCFANRCEQICNWTGRTGAAITCSGGTTCGTLQFRAEAGTSVAVCQ
jgi:hypothetical protein